MEREWRASKLSSALSWMCSTSMYVYMYTGMCVCVDAWMRVYAYAHMYHVPTCVHVCKHSALLSLGLLLMPTCG